MEMSTAKKIWENANGAFNGIHQASTGTTGAERAQGIANAAIEIGKAMAAIAA